MLNQHEDCRFSTKRWNTFTVLESILVRLRNLNLRNFVSGAIIRRPTMDLRGVYASKEMIGDSELVMLWKKG